MNIILLIKIFYLIKKKLFIEDLTKTKIVVLTNGLTNTVLKLSFNNKHFIIKIFNKIHNYSVRVNELLISKKLNFIPNIIFQNNDFRIEEFIESDIFKEDDKIYFFYNNYKPIINVIKIFHGDNFYQKTEIIDKLFNNWKDSKKITDLGININKIYKNITKFLFKTNFRIAFCHNDLIMNNILISNNRIHIIDLEYSGNNYILYEFANMFNELSIDYNNCTLRNIDIKPLEKKILYEYFGFKVDFNKLYEDISKFKKISNFLWTLWSFKQIDLEQNNSFDYYKYGLLRLSMFNNGIQGFH
jgi:thiamine kinase-like enzyme